MSYFTVRRSKDAAFASKPIIVLGLGSSAAMCPNLGSQRVCATMHFLLAVSALSLAASASLTRDLHVVPLSGSANDDRVLVVAIETTTLDVRGKREIFVDVDPIASLLAEVPGDAVEWSACGGAFRSGWLLDADADDAHFSAAEAQYLWAQSHTHCDTSLVTVCAANASQARMQRLRSIVGALTSSPVTWLESTAQHQRPLGLTTAGCQAVLSSHDTLCTQHLGGALGSALVAVDAWLQATAVDIPFFLSTRWHQAQFSVDRTATSLRLTRRLAFVLYGSEERQRWGAATQMFAHSARLYAPRRVHQAGPTVAQASGLWSLETSRDASPSLAQLELRIHITKNAQATGTTSVRLLVLVPVAVVRPLLLQLKCTQLPCNTKVIRTFLDAPVGTLSVVVEVPVVAAQEVVLPLLAVFSHLAERPPDAHMHYTFPQVIMRTPSSKCSAPQSRWLDEAFESEKGQCYEYVRSSAVTAPRIALATPDSAMVFNVLSLGLLPLAALVGTILRKTGRAFA